MTPIVPLRAILRAQGRRRPLTLRPIQTTQAQAKALQRIYAPVMQVWSEGVRERILPAYARSLATFTGDSPADIEVEIEAVDEEAVRATLDFRTLFREWASDAVKWHLDKIGSQLTYVTNVDLTTQLGGAQGTVDDLLARNVALVRDVSDQARGRIADIVFRGLQQRTPIRDVAKEINDALGLGRARSLRIASDQTVKMSAALDQLRQEQLGFSSFVWRHSQKIHYRPEHLARDGQVFRWDSEVAKTDPPGYAPFCGCKALAHMDMDDSDTPTSLTEINDAQKAYVVREGKKTGVEYVSAVDEATGEVFGRNSGLDYNVTFTKELMGAIQDPKRKILVHHNHPSSASFSKQDLLVLSEAKGMRGLYAHGHDGSTYYAERGRYVLSEKAFDQTKSGLDRIVNRYIRSGKISQEEIRGVYNHMVLLALNKKGRVKYTSQIEGGRKSALESVSAIVEDILSWI